MTHELLQELYTRSQYLTLDFAHIAPNTPAVENIRTFFETCEQEGKNPKAPELRQAFNDRLLQHSGMRYLISRYGEDRIAMLKGSSIAAEKRTLHLGIDIFSQGLEAVFAPCDGTIVRVGREPEDHSFGHYLVFRPDDSSLPYIFLGHLSSEATPLGHVVSGSHIANLGDYTNGENGGWSRHLHLQMMRELPSQDESLIGYASAESFEFLRDQFPDPLTYGFIRHLPV